MAAGPYSPHRKLPITCGLQRVLEGEKALRSECARKLRDVEKKIAALKNPGWWPVTASPGSQSEQYLLRQKQDLHKQLDMHSKQVGARLSSYGWWWHSHVGGLSCQGEGRACQSD
jgi:hypothetical protein